MIDLQYWTTRPAAVCAYGMAAQIDTTPSGSDEESRKILFGQDAAGIK